MRSRRRFDSSSTIAHPVNFDIQRERSPKYDAKNSIYKYTYIYVYDSLDNRYGFSISVQPEIDCTAFHGFVPMFEQKFKNFKSWQVCDWLAKWLIIFWFMDLRRPMVYRRSNVSLVRMLRLTPWIPDPYFYFLDPGLSASEKNCIGRFHLNFQDLSSMNRKHFLKLLHAWPGCFTALKLCTATCPSAIWRENGWTDFHGIFMIGRALLHKWQTNVERLWCYTPSIQVYFLFSILSVLG